MFKFYNILFNLNLTFPKLLATIIPRIEDTVKAKYILLINDDCRVRHESNCIPIYVSAPEHFSIRFAQVHKKTIDN